MAGKTYQVTVGEETYTIQRFRGLKAIMAMASMTRIAREVPDILADAVKEYSQRNTITITESMARLPRWQSFTVEDFDKAEKDTGKREIELPTPMTANEQTMYALPVLLEKARKEVVRLLALLIIPNAELKEADKADAVPDALDKYEDVLLYEAELDQLVDLALMASDVLQEQLADRKDRLGKLMKGLWSLFQRNRTTSPALPTSQQPIPDPGSTPQMLTPDAPTSSTDSEKPMDGTETQPSMESLGVNS